ncbi:MAG: winged helix-turn-helix domain-containing protein [Actinomycetota bacterium]
MAVRFGDCEIDVDRWELRRDGELVPLEPRAMSILVHVLRHRDRVVTKEELLDEVWGDRFVGESALTSQIKSIRKAVGDSGREQRVLRTVHGQGYMFVADVEESAGAAEVPAPAAPSPSAEAPANPVIAVLPFENQSGDPSKAHVADGLTADIITGLSKHRWLRVLPRATTASYAERPEAMAALRRDLEVDYVVEGAARMGGDRLRVTTNLTETAGGTNWWAERYDRRVDDLFDVLDEITDVIVASIEPEVGWAERDRVSRRTGSDLAAWDLYHLGIGHFFRFTAEDNLEAQRLLDEARRVDPGFADAHAWWAYACVLGMTYWDTEPTPEVLDAALAATQEALGRDGQNAVFHMLRGRVQLARRDYRSALADNEAAVDLNPTFAAAWCGLGDSLCYEGRYDEAIEQFERAIQLGSHDPQRWAFLSYGALALLFAERYDDAVAWTERAESIPNCQYWTTAHRTVALAHLGRDQEAAMARDKLLRIQPGFTVEYARSKLFYLKRPDQIEHYLGGLERAGVPAA